MIVEKKMRVIKGSKRIQWTRKKVNKHGKNVTLSNECEEKCRKDMN